MLFSNMLKLTGMLGPQTIILNLQKLVWMVSYSVWIWPHEGGNSHRLSGNSSARTRYCDESSMKTSSFLCVHTLFNFDFAPFSIEKRVQLNFRYHASNGSMWKQSLCFGAPSFHQGLFLHCSFASKRLADPPRLACRQVWYPPPAAHVICCRWRGTTAT